MCCVREEIVEAVPGITLILVGNKIDLERKVSKVEGEDLAKKLGLTYIETSAKTGENINDAFRTLALQLLNKFLVTENV